MSPDAGDRDDRIDRAMAAFLAALERGDRPDPGAYLAADPDLAADLGPLLANVASLHGAGREVGTDAAAVSAAPLLDRHTRLGGYEILRAVGRGGMGVVYEAVQQPLGRRVALKVLPSDAAIDPRVRRRFLHEARVAALLQHPHIVPVHAVGEADGVQFYAMQYIDGQPLDAVLRALRERAGLATAETAADPSSDAGLIATGLTAGFDAPGAATGPGAPGPGYVGRVVRLAADAAAALAYAHEAGVVHRDVKPGNLILDVRGKAWLTDFGLAKLRESAAADATTGRVGTLRYMSPEQAAGRGDAVDARTDVYALGLTLYELLTLRPAFSAATDSELLRLVAGSDPPAVRVLNPAVPLDLETVVQKATARDRADRYPSGREFATDLERFLAGLPVAARRLTRPQRGWRWMRRHRRQLTAAGAAVVLGLVLGLAFSMYFVWTAYGEAEARRLAAERREEELLALVEQLNLSEVVLKDLPGAQAEQRALVRRLKAVLARAADEPGASERIRWAAYRACRRLADVESRQGDDPASLAATREARDRLDGLIRTAPRTWEIRLELARSARDLGGGFTMNLDGDAAFDQLRLALQLFEELDAERPGRTEVLNELGLVRFALARGLAARGRTAEALAVGRRGLAVNEWLRDRYPTGHPLSYIRLASTHGEMGLLYCQAGDAAGAEAEFRASVAAEAVVLRDFPDPDRLRLVTVRSRWWLGTFLAGRGRFAEARVELVAVTAEADRLAAKFPADAGYRALVADGHRELGRIAFLEGKADEAVAAYRRMTDAHRALAAAGASYDATMTHAEIPVAGVVDPRPLIERVDALARRIPTDPWPAVSRGVARMRAGEVAAAEPILAEVMVTGSHDPAAVGLAGYYLACCRALRGDRAAARAALAETDRTNALNYAFDSALRVARREAVVALGDP